ncbi:hypothetical protein HH310_12475 [Actinoplanes sp. TBRC 11911]|uniref:hypothetical protein n=1 Tax=Actinoplanes sp. TBRC 11911 TaxID=2729386 RepID=UPI00145D3E82|nr:hypothetical protein [Actinoplanes sp. TBRC 11911]NMO52009.1 hypothetical protein [Actinoplanes sp. TBRC 11911]
MRLELTDARVEIGGRDVSGYVRSMGVVLDEWQAEVLDRVFDAPRSHVFEFRGRSPGIAAWLREFDIFLRSRFPFSIDRWAKRREAGWPAQSVEVDGDRVVYAVPVQVEHEEPGRGTDGGMTR